MASPNSFPGYQEPGDRATEFSAVTFLVSQMINRIATSALVRVNKVSNAGELAPVGTVDVTPMISQIDSLGTPVPHATIYSVPYFRLQGGTDAVILDPKVGDVGIAIFCSRDISTTKRTKKESNPESRRKFNWADGLYIGGFLNGVPTQFVRFSADGIEVKSPTKVIIEAPAVEVDGTNTITMTTGQFTFNGNAILNGNWATVGTFTNNGHDVGSGHRHTASGGTGVGGPPQ